MYDEYRQYLPLLDEMDLEEHDKLALLYQLHTLLSGDSPCAFDLMEAANDDLQ